MERPRIRTGAPLPAAPTTPLCYSELHQPHPPQPGLQSSRSSLASLEATSSWRCRGVALTAPGKGRGGRGRKGQRRSGGGGGYSGWQAGRPWGAHRTDDQRHRQVSRLSKQARGKKRADGKARRRQPVATRSGRIFSFHRRDARASRKQLPAAVSGLDFCSFLIVVLVFLTAWRG